MPTPWTWQFSRQLKGGLVIEAAYVGRLGRRLLTQIDAATPLDFKDKGSGIDYFTAVTRAGQALPFKLTGWKGSNGRKLQQFHVTRQCGEVLAGRCFSFGRG